MKVHVHAHEWLESPFKESPLPFLMQVNTVIDIPQYNMK